MNLELTKREREGNGLKRVPPKTRERNVANVADTRLITQLRLFYYEWTDAFLKSLLR